MHEAASRGGMMGGPAVVRLGRLGRRLFRSGAPWWSGEALFVLAFIALVTRRHGFINHDCALYLQCAQLLSMGQVPYVDFIEINPPWIMYMMLPVVWLAKACSVPLTLAFQLAVGGLVAVTWIELRALLCRASAPLKPYEIGTVSMGWIAASLMVWHFGDFGQRDHLFMLLYVPFLLVRLLRYEGRAVPVAVALLLGLQAGAGACMKPEFLALALVAETALLVGFRTWRLRIGTEVWAALAVGVGYVAHWALVPPAMRTAFFQRWVPAILRGYDAYSLPPSRILGQLLVGNQRLITLSGAGLLGGAWLAWRSHVPTRRLLLALVAIGMTSMGFYLRVHKGWTYQLTPLFMSGILGASLSWLEAGRALRPARALRWLRFSLIVAPLALGLLAALECVTASLDLPHLAAPLSEAIERLTARGDRVLVLSTSVGPSYPALTKTGRLPGSRYLWDFPVPFILYEAGTSGLEQAPPRVRAEQEQFVGELVSDIDRLKPRMIAINTISPCQGCPRGFDLVTYLELSGVMAHILGGYAEQPREQNLRLFVRTGS